MRVGVRWQNRKTREIVRIEVYFAGFLSFSVLREGQWYMCRNLWDEAQFKTEFSQVGSDKWDA